MELDIAFFFAIVFYLYITSLSVGSLCVHLFCLVLMHFFRYLSAVWDYAAGHPTDDDAPGSQRRNSPSSLTSFFHFLVAFVSSFPSILLPKTFMFTRHLLGTVWSYDFMCCIPNFRRCQLPADKRLTDVMMEWKAVRPLWYHPVTG